MYEYVCEVIEALGMAVVPEVKTRLQISSACRLASTSVSGISAIQSANARLAARTGPPIGMVTPTRSAAPSSTSLTRPPNSPSTTANRTSTCSTTQASTSGARFGLTGTATNPALAIPNSSRTASIEFSQ